MTIVIGGGYAGVMAANRISAAGVDVALVNPRAEFVERIRLHQLATRSGEATVPMRDVLAPGVELIVDTVTTIGESSVRLASGATTRFDRLVYAVGSYAQAPAHAHAVADLQSAVRLGATLAELRATDPVVVVGGGLTGIELATEIADRTDLTVRIVSRNPVGDWLSERARRALERRLARLNIAVTIGDVTEIEPAAVRLADGSSLPSACTVWAGGFRAPDLAARSGLPVDDLGRLVVDETLRCVHRSDVVGAGDAVATTLRMSCQAATPLGAHAADTVVAAVRGTEPRPMSLGFVGQAISLGRRRGLIQLTGRDDRPNRLVVTGPLAAVTKELVCRSTVVALRRPRMYRWLPA